MNINGSAPLATLQRPDDSAVALRLNQRFAAEVVQVSGERVVLEVGGVQIVARLTAPEQAAALIERRVAHFVVRDLAGGAVTLQMLNPGGAPGASPAAPGGDLAARLLVDSGLPADAANLLIARACLAQGLPVDLDSVLDLRALLDHFFSAAGRSGPSGKEQGTRSGMGAGVNGRSGEPGPVQVSWGQAEAQAAAALKAAGLPISPGTLALLQSGSANLVEALTRLQARLQVLAHSRPAPRLAALLQSALSFLDRLVVDPSLPPETLARDLQTAAAALGRSLESELAGRESSKVGLLALSHLRGELQNQAGRSVSRSGSQTVLDELDRFLDGLRLAQFKNSGPVEPTLKEPWLALSLPLRPPGRLPLQSAHLRIAYRPEPASPAVDTRRAHLAIQFDLQDGETVEVDLSFVDVQVGARVLASTPTLCGLAEAELPGLQVGLESLGYILRAACCEVGRSHLDDLSPALALQEFRQINITV